MRRLVVQITLLTGALLMGLVPLAMARTGVVATVTVVESKTAMATLKTTQGEGFDLPKDESWKVGRKVECERVDAAPRPRLQHGQPWQ